MSRARACDKRTVPLTCDAIDDKEPKGYKDKESYGDLVKVTRTLWSNLLKGLRSRHKELHSSQGVVELAWEHYAQEMPPVMSATLVHWHIDPVPYTNTLESVRANPVLAKSPTLRVRLAFMAFAISGLTGDLALAAQLTEKVSMDEANASFGTALPVEEAPEEQPAGDDTLYLILMRNGALQGDGRGYPVDPMGTTIGRGLAGEHTITAPGQNVSHEHCKIRRDEKGVWLVSDCGSRFGTTIEPGDRGDTIVVAPPAKDRPRGWESSEYPLRYSDHLILGGSTEFLVTTEQSFF